MTPTTKTAPREGEERRDILLPQPQAAYQIQTASLVLNIPMYHRQIPDLRKAICSVIDKDRQAPRPILTDAERMLFHNHDPLSPDGRVHSPALIHYRTEKSLETGGSRAQHLAWLFGINEGAAAVQKLMALLPNSHIYIGKRDYQAQVQDFRMNQSTLQASKSPQRYRLKYWIALSPHVFKNYWLKAPDFHAKAKILEERLNLHLSNFAKAMGYQLPPDARAVLQDFGAKHEVKIWGEKVIAFDIDYDLPYALPAGIALGRAVSHGYGIQHRMDAQ